jgi:DNA repair photolyase
MDQEQHIPIAIQGRGAQENPTGRFESIEMVPDPEDDPVERAQGLKTQFYKDHSKQIVSTNDSPDVGMTATVNPYRGCEHGCIYCYARPTHEYLGLSCGLDFETKIFVKTEAPRLLREKLRSPSWKAQVLSFSGVTDCYQPIERKLKITRQCLEVMAEFRNPVAIVTKNYLVTRDIDILSELAKIDAACVFISLTSLDESLQQVLEPRTASPALRLKAIRELSQAGIPVGILMGPIIPGLTDHEIDAILKSAAEAGAKSAYYTMVRLPHGVKDLFQTWLETHFPDKKSKVLNRIKEVRGGQLNSAEFGSRMTGEGTYAQYVAQMFELSKKRHGLHHGLGSLSTSQFRKDAHTQLQLF